MSEPRIVEAHRWRSSFTEGAQRVLFEDSRGNVTGVVSGSFLITEVQP